MKPSMRTSILERRAALFVALLTVACGGGDGPQGPDLPVFSILEVEPAAATLFTVAPAHTVALVHRARDQRGEVMSVAAVPSYSTDNAAVADVSTAGLVTAGNPGSARITTSLTANGVTKTRQTTITVVDAPATAMVTAPALAFTPGVVDIAAGGSVNWTFATVPHNVTFSAGNAPANVEQMSEGTAWRTFPANGSFDYNCTIHPGMTGTVRVH
jgi:plastocyanin